MGKRTLDDAGLAIPDPNIEEAITFKKVRKDSVHELHVSEVPSAAEVGEENVKSKAEKKEKKRLKKLKKAAKAAGLDPEVAIAEGIVEMEVVEEPHVGFKEDLIEVIGTQKLATESDVKPPPKENKRAKKVWDTPKPVHPDDIPKEGEPPLKDRELRKRRAERRNKAEKEAEEEAKILGTWVEPERDLAKEAELDQKRAAKKEAKKARKAAEKTEKISVAVNGVTEPSGDTNDSSDEDYTPNVDPPARTQAEIDAKKAAKKERKNAKKATKAEPWAPTNGSSDGYIEDAGLTAQPQAAIEKFLADNFITITDPKSTKFRPITNFAYLPVTNPNQLTPFKDFKAPTPIQAAAWPFLFAGRDVIGVAETGSGKTMAFAVPCVRAISTLPKNQRNKGARAVIVSPTRELAMQSFEQIQKLAKVSDLQAVCVYGGVPKDQQRRDLKTADIVIATPGRLNDLIQEGYADLSKAKYVVLDEADRMLDKGFEEEIRKIINTTPAIGKRQTLMFTATWPESVRSLAATFMSTPVKIAIGDNPTGDLRANVRILQKVEVVDPRNKEWRLMELLKQHSSGTKKDDRILVFCLYKKEATRIELFLRQKGFRVGGIHGDLSQEQRTRSLDAFKKGTTPILVATDVAARGLDIPDVQLVLNCTFPLTVEDYVHRIGRTGRAGKDGLAITLFTEHDKGLSGPLINVLKAANQEVPEELLKFGTTVKRKGHDAYGAFFKDVDNTKTATKITFD